MFDTNNDGIITTKECLTAIRNGVIRGAVQMPAAGMASSTTAPSSRSPSAGGAEISMEGLPTDADQRWVTFAKGRMQRIDADKNGRITVNEWSASEGDFNKVDTDGDGQITLPEYYKFKSKR